MARALIAAVLLVSGTALGMDGNAVQKDCGAVVSQHDGASIETTELLEGLFCVGYVAGLKDAFRMTPDLLGAKPLYCPPEAGVKNDQLVRIVLTFLRDNPNALHESARGSVLVALSRAFPCH